MLEFCSSRADFKTALAHPAVNNRPTTCCNAADDALVERSWTDAARLVYATPSVFGASVYRRDQIDSRIRNTYSPPARSADSLKPPSHHARIMFESLLQLKPNAAYSVVPLMAVRLLISHSACSRRTHVSQYSPRLKGILSCATVSLSLRSASSACPF
jgi:hypothetical protein